MDKKKRAKSNREEEKKVALKRDAKQGYRELVRKFGLNFELFKLFASTRRLGSSRSGLHGYGAVQDPGDIYLSIGDNFLERIVFKTVFSCPSNRFKLLSSPSDLFSFLCANCCAQFFKRRTV